jgi:hypothetical protein
MRISKKSAENEKPLVTRGDQGFGTSEAIRALYGVNLRRRVAAGQRK